MPDQLIIVCNHSLYCGTYPSILKPSKVVPVKGSELECLKCKPISPSSSIGKF